MNRDPRLSSGLTTRSLTPADSRAVYELMAAVQRAELGAVEIEESDILADWARPSHDLAASSVAVLDGDVMVGYAELVGHERYDAAVLPAYGGRGIGTWLAAWVRRLAGSRGQTIVGMPVPAGSSGDRLLTTLGYHVRWTSWALRVPGGARIPPRELPAGFSIGPASEEERRAAHDVLEDAFGEWTNREREPWADFEAAVLGRPGFAPWQLRVVREPGGVVVGVTVTVLSGTGRHGHDDDEVTAYVDRLAVRRDHRNQGLAQALLVDAFAAASAHGATVSELSTDSRTGALGLYEKVGMVVTSTWVHRAVGVAGCAAR